MFKKILVPLDGSKTGEVVLPYVRQLVEKLSSEVTLLQVVTPGQHAHTVGGLDYVHFTEEQLELMSADAKQYLEKVSSRLADIESNIRLEVRIGDAAQEIIKLADETDASLIAMSTHGRSGVSQWIFGSVAQKILQASTRPIFLVRASGVKA